MTVLHFARRFHFLISDFSPIAKTCPGRPGAYSLLMRSLMLWGFLLLMPVSMYAAPAARLSGAEPAFSSPLKSFSGQKRGPEVFLIWELWPAASVAKFEIESSHDAVSFYYVQSVTATGRAIRYEQKLEGRLSGYEYYRMRTIMADGRVFYSPAIRLPADDDLPAPVISILNVTGGELVIRLRRAAEGRLNFSLWSADGRLLHRFSRITMAGDNLLYQPVGNIPAGYYILQAGYGGGKTVSAGWVKR